MVESTAGLTGNTGIATGEQSKSDKSRQKLADDMDNFMNLLTTQLKHQDPLDPMKANEFTSQLVQFASVEQQIQSNANLEDLLALQQSNQQTSAVGFLDQVIRFESDKLPLQDGTARATYKLEKSAQETSIVVRDPSGRVVNTYAGQTSSGTHEFTWDGTDRYGNQWEDGTYSISVNASDGDGRFESVSTRVDGKVTGLSFDGDETVLSAGAAEVPMSKVTSVRSGQ